MTSDDTDSNDTGASPLEYSQADPAHLTTLQREVGAWSHQQFGDQAAVWTLIGAAEELGEAAECYDGTGRLGATLELLADVGRLCHSVLKEAQGIRQDEPGVGPSAERGAAELVKGDLKWLLGAEHTGTAEQVRSDEDLADAIADATIYTADFGARHDSVDYPSAVRETWDGVVSERDWDADVDEAALDGGGLE